MKNTENRIKELEALSHLSPTDPLFGIHHSSFPPAHPSESAGAATAGAPTATSLAVLLTRHILRDGELVILLLKPSVWFIVLSSLRFAAVVLILLFAAIYFDEHVPYNNFVW